MANILLRMLNSFAMMHAGLHRHAMPSNSSRAALFREQGAFSRCNFRHFPRAQEPIEALGVFYRGAARQVKFPAPIRHFPKSLSGEVSMTITTAHIQPIVALIAGVLILIMPRFLNLVVAIYLICVGLIGLGVLKWLHM
jgi:hypothetical protein